jgi:hypothetical protein
MRSPLKALYIITPSHWPVLSKDLLNSLGSIQPSCSSRSAQQAAQTQISFLLARYPFNSTYASRLWSAPNFYPNSPRFWRVPRCG